MNNSAEECTVLDFPVFLRSFSWDVDVIVGAPAAILDPGRGKNKHAENVKAERRRKPESDDYVEP